jgi:hypothetical protein
MQEYNAMDIYYLHWLLLIDVATILLFKHYLDSISRLQMQTAVERSTR